MMYLGSEGYQNMQLQNMPLWYIDYFELKTTEISRNRKALQKAQMFLS